MKKLGFGLMRLPKKGLFTDIEQVKQMVDDFIGRGFTYFDTAYVYNGSEAAAKKALVSRHRRDTYTLATKLNVNVAPSKKAAEKQLETSLSRTGAGYFDYYLLHAIMDNNYEKYEKYGLWDFVSQKKQQGVLKHIGFHSMPGRSCLISSSRSTRRWILFSSRSIMRIGRIPKCSPAQIMRSQESTANRSL